MILYRVTYSHEGGTSMGYGWFTSKSAAEVAARGFRHRTRNEDGDASFEAIQLPRLTKRHLLDLLNHYATYADNG